MSSKSLVRVEIITTQALDEDFTEAFKKYKVAAHFTKINPVMGAGFSNPHLGDAIWPQLNIMFIIYCSESDAETIKKIVTDMRRLYPTEGVGCFISSAEVY